MIVKSQIEKYQNSSVSFNFALLMDKKELIIKKSSPQCDDRDDLISLKNGRYIIQEGVLYIKATRVFWKNISRYCEQVELWGNREIYLPNESFQKNVENPPVVSEVIIHRWWRNNDKIQAIELSENDPRWYKQIQETQFEIAISNFRLNESLFAK